MKLALVAAAGLTLAATANANVVFTADSSGVRVDNNRNLSLTGGGPADSWSSNGTVTGSVTKLMVLMFYRNTSLTQAQTFADPSVLGDMQFTFSDGVNTVTVGGFDHPRDFTPGNSQLPLDFEVNYTSQLFDIMPLVGATGLNTDNLTVTFANDRANDLFPNDFISWGFILPSASLAVPTPGAMSLFGIAGLVAMRRRR